jgi:hypothetical protein
MLNNIEIKKRLLLKVEVDTSGCWLWTGHKKPNGYGQITINYKTLSTHRLSYELFKGPIPEGMYICHSCDVKACINPDHLWTGTHQDNMNDMTKKNRSKNQNMGKTHCIRGHAYTPKNTQLQNQGRRYCKTCKKIKNKERYEQLKKNAR